LTNIIDVLEDLVVKLLKPGFDIVELDRFYREVGLETTLLVVKSSLLHLRPQVQLSDVLGVLVAVAERREGLGGPHIVLTRDFPDGFSRLDLLLAGFEPVKFVYLKLSQELVEHKLALDYLRVLSSELVAKLHVKDHNHLICQLVLFVVSRSPHRVSLASLHLFGLREILIIFVGNIAVLFVGRHKLEQRLENSVKRLRLVDQYRQVVAAERPREHFQKLINLHVLLSLLLWRELFGFRGLVLMLGGVAFGKVVLILFDCVLVLLLLLWWHVV